MTGLMNCDIMVQMFMVISQIGVASVDQQYLQKYLDQLQLGFVFNHAANQGEHSKYYTC